MEKFICNLLAITKEDLIWLEMLNQKYHVIDEYNSIFNRFLETETGKDDPYSIIYECDLNPYLSEGAILTAIIRYNVDEHFDLKEGILTVEELLEITNNGKDPLNAYASYSPMDNVNGTTIENFKTLIAELKELHKKFENLISSKNNMIISNPSTYASTTRRR